MYEKYFSNNSGRSLVILLDGLDENLQAIEKGTFLYEAFIKANRFSHACLIITSRPHATADLQKHVSYRVEIVGFTDIKRRQYVQENLKGKHKDLEEYLQNHPTIDTLCYIPLNMSILLFLFHEKNRLNNHLPDTQTELTKQAVSMTILHNLEKLGVKGLEPHIEKLPTTYYKVFICLCKLAYKELSKNKYIFTNEDIKELDYLKSKGIIQEAVTNGLGLLHKAQFFGDYSGSTNSLSNFAHSSIQEFLAAWYFTTFSYSYCFPPLPLKYKCLEFLSPLYILKEKFWAGDYMNMWSFYIGLTSGLDSVFKSFLSGTNMLNCCCMQCKNFSISKDILSNKIKVLHLYFFLQEAPGNEITQLLNVVVAQNMLNISGQNINLKEKKTDLELLGYILSRPYLTRQWNKVILSCCKIDDESFKLLQNILTRNDRSPKIKCLSLSDNQLISCSEAIVNLVCMQEICHLNLSNNKLKDLYYFQKCTDFLVSLNISDNKFDDKRALELFNVLKYFKKLKVLDLSNNNIGTDQKLVDVLGLSLCYCNSLEEIEIYGNLIEDEALIIFDVIKDIRNTESNIHYYRLTDKASAFLKIIRYCDQIDYHLDSCALRNKIIQFKVVNVSYNGLGDVAGCLGQYLHLLVNLEILNISKNNIPDHVTACLTTGILLTPKLNKFEYKENSFADESIMVFKMISKLRAISKSTTFKCAPADIIALEFILTCINDNQEKVQSSDVVSTISNITKLDLSHDPQITPHHKVTSEELNRLCAVLKWFKQLTELDVTKNDITDEATESIAKAMLQICTLSNLKLYGNPIYNDKFSMSVFRTVREVHEKKVHSMIYNRDSPQCLECHYILYVMDCVSKLETPNCFELLDCITTIHVDADSDIALKVLKYLNFLACLETLKINNVKCITNDGINQLSKYLSNNTTLTTLDLSCCNLKDLEVEKRTSSHCIKLKELKFNHSNVTDQVLLSLNMLKFSNLNHLQLEGNNFGDAGIINLHNIFLSNKIDQPTTTIAELNLADNHLTIISAAKIIEIVEKCEVKYLNISNNYLGCILPYFENHEITLEQLNISANNHQTDNVVEFVANISYLKYCRSLKVLNIANNNINETTLDELYCTFMKCSYGYLGKVICNDNPAENEIELAFHFVKSLQSHAEHIELKGLPRAAQALISTISLPCNDHTREFITSVRTQIRHVTLIDFSSNKIEIDQDLVCFLENCTQLKNFNLEDNSITNDTFEHLATGFLLTSKLKLSNLHLKGNPCMSNPKNKLVLQTIDTLRCTTKKCYYECHPPSFESFLTVLKCVDTVKDKESDISNTISSITYLNISYSASLSDSYNQCLKKACQKLQSSDIKTFCKYLKYFKSLKRIDMKDNDIEEDIKDDLTTEVLKQGNIDQIHLEGNPINRGKCFRLFDTIQKMRNCGGSYAFRDYPETLEALVNILQYIDGFNDKTCDITKNIEHLDISWFHQPQHKPRFGIQKKVQNPEIISTSFIHYLKLFSKLKKLNLSHAYLTLNALQELSEFLQNNNTL